MMAAQPSGGSRVLAHGPPDGLCLAFANTKFWRGSPVPTEELHGPADLLRWCEGSGTLDAGALRQMGAAWEAQPEAAASGFAAAIALREAIFRVFAATASGGGPAPGDLETLNAALAMAPGR